MFTCYLYIYIYTNTIYIPPPDRCHCKEKLSDTSPIRGYHVMADQNSCDVIYAVKTVQHIQSQLNPP